MEPFNEYANEFKRYLKQGYIQEAYKRLIEYVMGLRLHFKKKHPDFLVSGSIYIGYMDMTYFALFPKSMKGRKLKIAIVFVYDTFRFEVWLAGYNKRVQKEYWEIYTDEIPASPAENTIIEAASVLDRLRSISDDIGTLLSMRIEIIQER